MNKCKKDDCNKPVKWAKLCNKHYEWQRRHPGQPIVYREHQSHDYHGMTDLPVYRTWLSMVQRCHNKNAKVYKWYGAKGTKVCDEWRGSFQKFYAYVGPRPSNMSLDRIDNRKGYEPGNVRWATRTQQAVNRGMNCNNKSGTTGVNWSKSAKAWSAELSVNRKKVFRKTFKDLDSAIKARLDAEERYIKNPTASL